MVECGFESRAEFELLGFCMWLFLQLVCFCLFVCFLFVCCFFVVVLALVFLFGLVFCLVWFGFFSWVLRLPRLLQQLMVATDKNKTKNECVFRAVKVNS